ncbi:MAG: GNAT family N-acetyltransferase [Rhodobacter sp.]|nr:GNAT family N-acetyltransferase [Rhodobacter sp.]
MTLIRELDPVADAAAVRHLFDRATDYLDLETGEGPSDATVADFFAPAPFATGPADALKLGLFSGGRLDAIADLAFGFPEPQDAFIGLLLIAADQRGHGLGHLFVDHIADVARARRAPCLFVAVLEANPRARAFWEREGFVPVLTLPPAQMGQRVHLRHRMERRL